MNKKRDFVLICGPAFVSLIIVLFLLTGCTVSPGSGSTGQAPVYSRTNRVAVIGDSISAGINPDYSTITETYGWADMLNGESYITNYAPSPNIHNIWSGIFVILSNFAISGTTASYWNNSFSLTPVSDFQPDIIIIFIGANDVLDYLNDGVFSDPEKTALSNNFIGIVDILTNTLTNAKLVIVDYYDLFDGYSSYLSLIPNLYSKYSNLSAYTVYCDTMLSNNALARGYYFVDNYAGFMNHCYGASIGGTGHLLPNYLSMTTNDIHPITAGHRKIFDNVLDVLKKITN